MLFTAREIEDLRSYVENEQLYNPFMVICSYSFAHSFALFNDIFFANVASFRLEV